MAFDQSTRNRLQKFVGDARKLLSDEFTQQLQNTYGLDPVTGGVAALSDLPALSPSEQQTAQLLRDTLEHYLAASHKADPYKDKALVAAALDRIVREQAFTVLNRLAALRMAEARQFVIESISQGYQSKGFQLYQRIAGSSLGETGQTYQHYLFSVFDELSLDLAVLFDRYSSQGRLFPRETTLLELLDLINHAELEMLWVEDETVGWIYQYFNSKEERKKMRDESQAPRNSRELAVRNQFFTPRYVVEFLTDNTLGRIWYEMTQGNTALVDSCQYLVRRQNEIFLKSGEVSPEQDEQESTELSQDELLQQTAYIQHRPIKDPRDIKMLDPACGSMHFGLYAFDLFEQIYAEAWDVEEEKGRDAFWCDEGGAPKDTLHDSYPDKECFVADVPRLIIEHNIHGVDIDPRAAQIAGLSLWLRAQKSWSDIAIKPNQRPQIQRSNIACAEPMPGETELLKEFTQQIQPRVLGQLVEDIFEKMQLAGEAGALLKIEEEIQSAIEEAKSQKDEDVLEVQGGLFGDDIWEVREGKRYYNFGDVSKDFWGQAEQLILLQLERYAEKATGTGSGQKRLFSADAARGFSFIDVCSKNFDIVLMNPPFGEPASKTSSYIDKNYKDYCKNILCAFLIRGMNFGERPVVGAIYDKTALIKSTYTNFRKSHLVNDSRLIQHVDLGWGVLDANVEVACNIVDLSKTSPGYAPFIDVRKNEPDKKGVEILSAVKGLLSGDRNTKTNIVNPLDFNKYPNQVLGHDFPEFVRKAFSKLKPIHSYVTLFEGHTLKSDVFIRYWWEVPLHENIDANSKWVRLYCGGSYQRYVSPLCDVAPVGVGYKIAKTHPSSVLRNFPLQGEGKIGFGKRGEFVDAHVVPNDFSSNVEGKHAVINSEVSEYTVLSLLNSKIFQYVINLYCGQHKTSGYVGIFPVPDLVKSVEMDRASKCCEEIFCLLNELQVMEETSAKYGSLSCLSLWDAEFSNLVINYLERVEALEYKMNDFIYRAYGLSLSDQKLIESYSSDLPPQSGWWNGKSNIIDVMRLSQVFGVIFGRWNIEKLFSTTLGAVDVFSPIKPQGQAVNVEGQLEAIGFGHDDIEIERLAEKSFDLIVAYQDPGKQKNVLTDFLPGNYTSLGDYFLCSNGFFDDHIKMYSKSNREAPIFLLAQSKRKKYSIWLNFLKLNEQTLMFCVNDFVDPALKAVRSKINAFNDIGGSLKDKEMMMELQSEEEDLIEFRYQLVAHTKFWKPCLNDGVQITMAPLWEMFLNVNWRSKLKKKWEALENGEYDWSAMAYNYWPERILRKCHHDRSIAIAHGVETDLWEAVERPVGKGKKTKIVWQPKEMTDTEVDTYIKNKIEQG